MLTPVYTKQFEKDIKRMKKRGKDLEKLKRVVRMLLAKQPLEPKLKDHALVGNWKGRRECHLEPDWLLVYKVQPEVIVFERSGTHSDLF